MTSGPTRTPIQREKDLQTIAGLYLRGALQSDIASQLKLSQQQISYDIKELKRRWKESALFDFDEAKGKELARVDNLEVTYWDAWTRSLDKATRTVQTSMKSEDESTISARSESTEQFGDPRFLSGVQWCIDRRCKILGLDAPVKSKNETEITLRDYTIDIGKDEGTIDTPSLRDDGAEGILE